ncbi:MAG: NAD(P)H-binding protein [Actinobacteria bacterium]|nr:NAD(P)H-binding protein [Actinomycetota bacterium]
MARLTVFGATGPTGALVLSQALDAGHEVRAVVRRPEAITVSSNRLEVFEADVLDELPAAAVRGSVAVISALGSSDGRRPTTVYSRGIAAIAAAMDEVGVRRLVAITGAPVAPADERTWFERNVQHRVLHVFFGAMYDDMRVMENELRRGDLDWTVFRPPRLTNRSAKGTWRTAVDGPLSRARTISRADLAAAMLKAIDERALARHAVTIAD